MGKSTISSISMGHVQELYLDITRGYWKKKLLLISLSLSEAIHMDLLAKAMTDGLDDVIELNVGGHWAAEDP